MKNCFKVLAGLMFLTLPAFAAAPEPETIPFPDASVDSLVIPSTSPVHYSGSENRGNWKVATFEGRFLLTGTYYYGDAEFNDSDKFMPEAAIVPDPDVVASLPHFALRNGRYNIHIDDADAFANAAISKATLNRVRRKGGGYATGHVAILVDQFSAGIACDGPDYGARFLSVFKPAPVRIASNEPSIGC